MNEDNRPYIAIVFANRNDNYAGDQPSRINSFIRFYSYYDKLYPGLFEFLICDWNTPSGNGLIKDSYNWSMLSNVRHFVVTPEMHQKIPNNLNKPFLDYFARNVCIRRASAPFVLMSNQDMFLSSSVFAYFAERKLSSKHFYRADRCDFSFPNIDQYNDWKNFDHFAISHSLVKHIREKYHAISLNVSSEEFDTIYTKPFLPLLEWVSSEGIAYSYGDGLKRRLFKYIDRILSVCGKSNSISDYGKYARYGIHTNASGDFLLASKKAFCDINGLVESSDFYMHSDSYACVQLFAAGYSQAILLNPHNAFHNDHERPTRPNEPITFDEHATIFAKICAGEKSFKLNDESWGLRDFEIKESGS